MACTTPLPNRRSLRSLKSRRTPGDNTRISPSSRTGYHSSSTTSTRSNRHASAASVGPDGQITEGMSRSSPVTSKVLSRRSPSTTELTFAAEVCDGWITRHVEVGGGRPSLAGWLVVAWVSDGGAARLHIRTNSRTVTMPMVLRIVIDTVTSGSAPKGKSSSGASERCCVPPWSPRPHA